MQTPTPGVLMHIVPGTQSIEDAQGNAHFPYWRLHRWVAHCESSLQGNARGPGTLSAPSVDGGGDGSAGGASRVTCFDGAADAAGIGGT